MHHTKSVHETVTTLEFASEFARDVYIGLSSRDKWLSSKYFYDRRGDEIFQQIMGMDAYYLSRSELEIFNRQAASILSVIGHDQPFRIIELGAGDGQKTKVLLKHFLDSKVDFAFDPCDISLNVLKSLEEDLKQDLPDLNLELQHGDYFKVLAELLEKKDGIKNVVFFLGSNIGNFSGDRAVEFLQRIRANLHQGDQLMMGVDLKKDPKVILNAYNDPQGITASFNLNLLERINQELGGDFDVSSFKHYPIYQPDTGECRSYLMSLKKQKVFVESMEEAFLFEPWETIFTEISRKYAPSEIDDLAVNAGFETKAAFTDGRGYFQEVIWEAI